MAPVVKSLFTKLVPSTNWIKGSKVVIVTSGICLQAVGTRKSRYGPLLRKSRFYMFVTLHKMENQTRKQVVFGPRSVIMCTSRLY